SRGSLWVETSPEGLRQAMAHACGERIMTPSSNAWPPPRVSSPPSSADRSCTATKNRANVRKNCMMVRCSFGGRSSSHQEYHSLPWFGRVIRTLQVDWFQILAAADSERTYLACDVAGLVETYN